jgi:hypothetical protein
VANLYGVANTAPNLQWLTTIGNANVTCVAGVETNVFATSTITAFDRGIYYPVAWGVIVLNFGATQSTNLAFALRVNSGADIVAMQANIPAGSQNAAQTYPFAFTGPAMPTAFWPAGSVIQVSVLAGGFNCTATVGYSNAVAGIFRAPDQ